MINATFKLGGDVMSIKIEGANLFFFDVATGQVAPIEGLRLSKAGVLKEFPDLKDEIEWKKIAIKRLKNHIKELSNEEERLIYVKDELIKFGYEPLMYQKSGFRTQKFKNEK